MTCRAPPMQWPVATTDRRARSRIAARDQLHVVANGRRPGGRARQRPRVGEASQSMTPGPSGSFEPERGGAVAAEVDQRRRHGSRAAAQRHRTSSPPSCRCRPSQPNKQSRDSTPNEPIATNWGKPKAEPIDACAACQRVRGFGALASQRGGVWAPGGLHRLQSGRDGRSPSGGFDSRPPPPTSCRSERRGCHERRLAREKSCCRDVM